MKQSITLLLITLSLCTTTPCLAEETKCAAEKQVYDAANANFDRADREMDEQQAREKPFYDALNAMRWLCDQKYDEWNKTFSSAQEAAIALTDCYIEAVKTRNGSEMCAQQKQTQQATEAAWKQADKAWKSAIDAVSRAEARLTEARKDGDRKVANWDSALARSIKAQEAYEACLRKPEPPPLKRRYK